MGFSCWHGKGTARTAELCELYESMLTHVVGRKVLSEKINCWSPISTKIICPAIF